MDEALPRVLLIEDNPVESLAIREMLSTVSPPQWHLEWADRLDGGLQYLTQNAVDVVLVDVSEVRGQGLRRVRAVHTQAPDVPMVILASPDDEWMALRVQEGAQEYVLKRPVDGNTLARALRCATERQQLQERLRLLAEHGQDIIFRYRLVPTPGVEYVSPAVTAITGYTPQEFLADPDLPFKIVYPPDRSLLTAAGYDLSAAPGTAQSVRWRHKDGRVIWLEESLTPIYDGRGNLLVVEAIARDVTARKQAAENLRASEEQFRLLVHGVTDYAIFMLDPAGRVVSWNVGAERIKGYRAEEIMGEHVSCFYPPEEVTSGKPTDALAQAVRTGRCEEEGWRVRKDGSRFWAHVVITALFDDARHLRGFARVTRDVTAHKQAEDRLRESEARVRAIVDHAAIGIAGVGRGGEFVETNTALQRIFGYSAAEFRHLSIQQLIHSDDREASLRLFRDLVDGKRTAYQVEKQYVRKDGTTIWGRTTVSLVQETARGLPLALGMFEDITEQKQTQEALRRGERHFRLLVENSSDIVAVLDGTGTTRYVSPSVTRILGYETDDLVGTPAFDFVHPDDRVSVVDAFTQLIQSRDRGPRVEFRFRHRDGSWKILEAAGVNLQTDPDVAGIAVNLRDVTQRKHLQARLVQAQKLEAIGRLVDEVAHDFRNVLTAINGFSDLLRVRLPPSDPRYDLLTEIIKAGETATALSNRLLAFSHQQVLPPTVLDLNALVRRMETMLRLVGGDTNDIEMTLSTDPVWVSAETGRIEQVLMNLVTNARDAMPQGGRLVIETATADLNADFTQRYPGVAPGPAVMLRVSDTGIGMDAHTQAHIFEPFFTTKEEGQGGGIGLATVYAIVKRNGGAIDVISAPGQGTTVTIYLPAVDRATAVQMSLAAPSDAADRPITLT